MHCNTLGKIRCWCVILIFCWLTRRQPLIHRPSTRAVFTEFNLSSIIFCSHNWGYTRRLTTKQRVYNETVSNRTRTSAVSKQKWDTARVKGMGIRTRSWILFCCRPSLIDAYKTRGIAIAYKCFDYIVINIFKHLSFVCW